MLIPITAVYASLTALLFLFLAWRVTVYRRRFKVGVGDGGQRDLEVAIRAHGNLVEYAPITLILMAIGEMNGVSPLAVYGVGLLFLSSRLLHAWGFIKSRGGYSRARVAGILLGWLALVVMVVFILDNVNRVSLW
ncbi:MAG: MAPEG family protein [Marinobacter sp.]|nr:MAPEG family protein [Marinobacter sp.]